VWLRTRWSRQRLSVLVVSRLFVLLVHLYRVGVPPTRCGSAFPISETLAGASISLIGARDTIEQQGIGSSLVQRRLRLSAQWSGTRAPALRQAQDKAPGCATLSPLRRVQVRGFSAPWRAVHLAPRRAAKDDYHDSFFHEKY